MNEFGNGSNEKLHKVCATWKGILKNLPCFAEALLCFPSSWKNMNILYYEYIYK